MSDRNPLKRPIDRRKNHTISLRINDFELYLVEQLAESLESDKSQAIRFSIWLMNVLFDRDLGDIVQEKRWDRNISEVIKPVPVLAKQSALEMEFWEKQINMDGDGDED